MKDADTAMGGGKERHLVRASLAVALALLLAGAALGCGSGGDGPAAVHVGAVTIGEQTVARWAHAIERGASAGGAQGEAQGGARQRALAFLISAAWLRGEAAARGVSASGGAVDAALREREEANGHAEFKRNLGALGQSVGDVRLEVEAELDAAALDRMLLGQAPPATSAQVAAYYATHRRSFVNPEIRKAELIEGLSSPAAARALLARIGLGAAFSKRALHEELELPTGGSSPPDIEAVTRAIFRTPVGVASEPMSLNGHWTVFVVRSIIPASYKPLAEARARIERQLAASARRATVADFASAYRARWTARTSCAPGYVVPGCVQYAGPLGPEVPFAGA